MKSGKAKKLIQKEVEKREKKKGKKVHRRRSRRDIYPGTKPNDTRVPAAAPFDLQCRLCQQEDKGVYRLPANNTDMSNAEPSRTTLYSYRKRLRPREVQ